MLKTTLTAIALALAAPAAHAESSMYGSSQAQGFWCCSGNSNFNQLAGTISGLVIQYVVALPNSRGSGDECECSINLTPNKARSQAIRHVQRLLAGGALRSNVEIRQRTTYGATVYTVLRNGRNVGDYVYSPANSITMPRPSDMLGPDDYQDSTGAWHRG